VTPNADIIVNGFSGSWRPATFRPLLGNVKWKAFSKNKDINHRFDYFLYIFLKTFEASFPIQNEGAGKLRTTALQK
jgi:hypothetical protein